MRRVIASLAAALAVALSVLVGASPASASGVCGPYSPERGRVTTSHNGDRIHVTAAFRLSDNQLANLRSCGDYLELSYWFNDAATIAGNSQHYEIYSNLPGATHDVGFHDATFSPGITGIPTDELRADTPYYGTVEFNSGTNGELTVAVGFSPSHVSLSGDLSDPVEDAIEAGACFVGDNTTAWCIFPTDTTLLTQPYGGAVSVVNGGKYPYDWGRYDLPNIG